MKNKRKSRSFARRLAKWLVLTQFVIMGLVSYLIFELGRSLFIEEEGSCYEMLLRSNTENIRRITSDVYVAANNHIPEIEESLGNPDRMFDLMERIVSNNPRIFSCGISFVADYYPQKGHWFCPYAVKSKNGGIERKNIGSADHDYLNADWFKESLVVNKGYWSKPFFEENDSSQHALVSYLAPIHDRQGRVVAILGADLSLQFLQEKLAKIDSVVFYQSWLGPGKTSKSDYKDYEKKKDLLGPKSFIITSDGTYIAHTDKKRILRDNYFNHTKTDSDTIALKVGREMIERKQGYYGLYEEEMIESFPLEGKSSYIFYSPIKHTDWSLAVVIPAISIDMFAAVTGGVLLFFIILGMLFMFLVGYFVIKRAAKPLKQLSVSANDVAKGNFNTELPQIKHNDEIGMLRDSFDNMQHSLLEYTEELKSTTASKAAIEQELKVAHDIQMGMLPKIFPPYPERDDIDIYGMLNPAKDVGGDLFDFYIRDNQMFFCIGDVSGKGVPASLVMAVTRSLFRNISSHTIEPDIIVAALNNALTEGNDTNMFVTIFVGVLDLSTGLLRYCNGGHDVPLLINSEVSLLSCESNLPVGVMPDMKFMLQQVTIEPNTTIFLYTDGLSEAENNRNQLFGIERVISTVKALLDEGNIEPNTIVNKMVDAVHVFVGEAEQSDDLTMLAIKYVKNNGRQG